MIHLLIKFNSFGISSISQILFCYSSSFVIKDEIVKDSNVLSELFSKMLNDSFSSGNFSPDSNFFQYMGSLPKFKLYSSLSINNEDNVN